MNLFNNVAKKIKDWITGQDRKKLIENTAIVIIIGVIIIIAGSVLFSGNSKSEEPSPHLEEPSPTVAPAGRSTDEIRLKAILSQIQGAGKVDVMIAYASSKESVPAYDVKKDTNKNDEKDSEGGTRNIREEEYESVLAYEDPPTGGKSPVILKELEPEIKGVLVVAEGADDIEVRDSICGAVTVVLDIPIHKVRVVQRKK